ncbi:MAG: hypothetical protein ACJAVI_005339 [Candidatus Azotimanducaceae bacterium]|jgi:hypothetical protein
MRHPRKPPELDDEIPKVLEGKSTEFFLRKDS